MCSGLPSTAFSARRATVAIDQIAPQMGRSKIALSRDSASLTDDSMSPVPLSCSDFANMSATMYWVWAWAVCLLGGAGQPGHLPGFTTCWKAFILGSALGPKNTGSLSNPAKGPALYPPATFVYLRYCSLSIR